LGEAEPAWWLNLQAHPDATVELVDGKRNVRARAPLGNERSRLWVRWAQYDKNLDQYAALRPRETAVVIFEPSAEAAAVAKRDRLAWVYSDDEPLPWVTIDTGQLASHGRRWESKKEVQS
jgi:hypothetical protein